MSSKKKNKKHSVEEEKTKKYKKVDNKENKGKKDKTKKKHPKLRKFIKIVIFLAILMVIVVAGILAGIFYSDKWTITKEQLLSDGGATIYNKNGEVISTLTGDEISKKITLDDMNKYLPDAFIAIEDKRFYNHHGVDIKRTAVATLSYIIHLGKGTSSGGGSTITQQLIKITMKDKDDSGVAGITRKIREMSRAMKVEKMLEKNQILERYLNRIYLGGGSSNITGVEAASRYYFNKTAKEVSLAQAAFIAGINHSPNSYDPYDEQEDNSEVIQKRTLIVLQMMHEQGKINSEEEYNEAVEQVKAGLTFEKGTVETAGNNISWHTAAAINQIAQEISDEDDIDFKEARQQVISSGYKIYTTEDSAIQDIMEQEFVRDKYIYSSRKVENTHSQAAMVIIDPKTGYVVGEVGALGSDSNTLGLNRGTGSTRQPGSSIKPIATIAPGLEKGIITAATVYDDSITTFPNSPANWPRDAGNSYQGLSTIRKAIEVSANVPEVKVMYELTPTESIKFMKQLGITSLDDNEDANLSLALGGCHYGISPLQMAAAYATIANDGVYIEPTFYTKIEDQNGNLIRETEQETRRVMSEANAYIEKTILKEPVEGAAGTARGYRGDISAMDVAAKTGTTNDDYDRWLCGFTPYYAAATWYGYDTNEGIRYSGNPSSAIWFSVMSKVHKPLESKRFTRPDNIVSATICLDTGKRATESCTRTYAEIFVKGTVPNSCDGHQKVNICKETNKVATEFCTDIEEKAFTAKPPKEASAAWRTNDDEKYEIPTETCDVHTQAQQVDVPNVVGKTQETAKKELEDAGFVVDIANDEDKSKKKGVVLRQSTTKAAKGSTVTITVNSYQKPSGGDKPNNSISNTTNTTIENEVDNNTVQD